MADFGNDDFGGKGADAGDRAQDGDCLPKGLDVGVNLLVDFGNGRIDGVDLLKKQAQDKAVMLGAASTQCRLQVRRRRLDPPIRQRRMRSGRMWQSRKSFHTPSSA